MKLHISSKGRAVSKRLRRFVADRVEQATQRFSNRVNRVDVSVTNSESVIDQECRVVLSVKGRKDIVATGTSENIMAAIAEAVDRAKRGLTKTLDRSRRRRASPHVF
ncbi:MAG: ribosome-associated translation inhibitor RaiA [Planctomycetaceae bacterium]